MIFTQIRPLSNSTSRRITWFPETLRKTSPWLCLTSSLVLMLGSVAASSAQSTSNHQLPPPPVLKNVAPASTETIPDITPKKITPISVEGNSTDAAASQPLREYTFEAPQTLPARNVPDTNNNTLRPLFNSQPRSTPQPTGNPSFYRVEVSGNQASLLSQVKVIEPMAFIRRNEGVIQGGLFQNVQQAETRVQELQNKGITATIVPIYRGEKRSLSVQIKP
ncbi:MAG: hypothetical protein AAGF26_17640 [Cyanobacteria bacterium P01_G01_bin.49]